MVAGLRDTSSMLTDGVITLREPSEDDADAIVEAVQDPEIPRWTGVPSPSERSHAGTYVERVRHGRATESEYAFLCVDADGTLLGALSLMELGKREGYGEIGYWIAAPARGRGVASRAVALLREWAVQELGLHTIELVIHEDNVGSRRVAERTGFLATGERRPAPRQEPPGPLDHDVYVWSPE
jgi:RimJ/RimL family protein N-acetyltransferase